MQTRIKTICFCAFLIFPAIAQSQSQSTDSTFSISAGGGQTAAGGGDTPLGIGYARIMAETDSVGPAGVALIEFRDAEGVLISELAVPAVEPAQQGRFFAEVGGAVTTVLVVANPNNAPATFQFYFTDEEGVFFGNGSLPLGPGEQFVGFLDQEPFGSGGAFAGTLTFEASVPVAVNAIRGFSNEAGEFLMSRLPVADLNSASSSAPVYFPYFTAGGGWASEIVLVNPSAETITGTIEYVGREGDSASAGVRYAVPPRGFLKLTDSDRSGDLRLGLAMAVPDADSAAPRGHVVGSFAAAGKTVTETAIPAMPPGMAFRVFAEMAGEAGAPGSVGLGLALANAGAAWNSVTLELADLDGIPLATAETVALPPSGHRFVVLDELFPLQAPSSGVLRLSSEADVAVAAVRFVVNERGEAKISATPPAAELMDAIGGATYFPLAVELEGWSTRYLLIDRSAYQGVSGQLDIFDQAGRYFAAGRIIEPSPVIGGDFSYAGRLRLICEDCGGLDDATVVLSGRETLRTAVPDEDGSFQFFGLEPGSYTVQIRKAGFRGPPAREIRVLEDGTVSAQSASFALLPLDSDSFEFHWQEDQSTAGHEYASLVNEPIEIEILGEQATMADGTSASRLLQEYNIALVDRGDQIWSHEHAYRLLRTMETIPQEKRDLHDPQTLPASNWLIASGHVQDDIRIDENAEGVRTVWISPEAFVNANPKIALFEGQRGSFFSQRLHHAAVRFVTDDGRDEAAYEKILRERYGVTTRIGGDAEYQALTGEPASRFQAFHGEEIVQIINTFEEMPAGMRAVPGLDLLVRRLDGTDSPYNPQAPAIAWVDSGYIEFMERAFNTGSIGYVHRLIIHEKAHFLWEHLFDERLKNDWMELGGWYRDANDPDGWSTTKQTEFVNAYAHGVNPNEDMAESIAHFVINPDLLRSRSQGKYDFLRDRVMGGTFYVSQIREDLTFQVYNLYPDYVFPGKIREVRILVSGDPDENKLVTVEIGLHAADAELEGASRALTRIFSDVGTYYDLWLRPAGGGPTGTVLTGSFTASKYAKAGYWSTDAIQIYDEHGNARLHGANDFGWSLYLNNPLEDLDRPEYIPGSAVLTVESGLVAEGREVQMIEATWRVNESADTIAASNACYAALNDENAATYSFQKWGDYDQQTNQCRVSFIMPHYMPSSAYVLSFIKMVDKARNGSSTYFKHPEFGHENRVPERNETFLDETTPMTHLTSLNPDLAAPELDVNNIRIDGTATQPEDPNGETLVTLNFNVRDNISGFYRASLLLRDPQGLEHFFYVHPSDRGALFPTGDPSAWAVQDWSVLLPAGSAPGIWGLAEMTVWDRAQNFKQHDFTEVLRFVVE